MRAAGVIDSLMIPMWNDHVGGTTKKEDLIRLGDLTDFFIPLIGRADHLLVGSIRENNVAAFFIKKDFAFSEC